MKEKKMSQIEQFIESLSVRIAIVNNQAYWIQDNQVYKSGLDENGRVDIDNATPIDVFSLNEKETKNLLKIIDNLSE